MEVSPLAVFDRLSSRTTFRGFTGSPCGIIGTLLFLAVTAFINFSIIVSYSRGNYFQSSFETQASPNTILQSPYDIRMALVFYNKTSGAVANHTFLANMFDTRIFTTNQFGNNINVQAALFCNGTNSKYFQDAVNPIILPDCYLFTPNRSFIYAYVNTVSSPLQYTTTGFTFSFLCLNPYTCRSGGTGLASVQGNISAVFTNFSMVFYFSTRVLQPDGSTRHQVYNISSGEFTNPLAVSAAFDVEVMLNNITMDYSIMPWANMVYLTNLAYYGFKRASPRTAASVVSPLPKIDIISSIYQNQIYRYYKKEDWLLGIIGGSAFFVYLFFWALCHPYNQSLFRINAAEELLIQVNPVHDERIQTQELLKKAVVPLSYAFLRFFSYSHKTTNTLAAEMSITNIIKLQKIALRNLRHFLGPNLVVKQKQLYFQDQNNIDRQKPIQQQRLALQSPEKPKEIYQQLRQEPNIQQNTKRQNFINQSSHKLINGDLEDSRPIQDDANLEDIKKTDEFQYLNLAEKKQSQQGLNLEQQREKPQAKPLNQPQDSPLNVDAIPIESFYNFRKQEEKEEYERKSNVQNRKIESDGILELNQNSQKGRKREGKEKSSDDKVLSGPHIEQQRRSQLQNDQNSNVAIIMGNQEQNQLQKEVQRNRFQAELLGLHPQVLAASKKSENSKHLLQNFPTIMHLTNNYEAYDTICKGQAYHNDDEPPKLTSPTKCQRITSQICQFMRMLDIFKVKVSFNGGSANHSWVGVFFTLLIIALPFLQVGNMLHSSNIPQVYISRDFQSAKDINYALKIGPHFRPAVCTSMNALFFLTGSSQTVQLLFYTYSASQGYTYYTPVQLGSNQRNLLGITPDSLYNNLDTSTCFVFPDGTNIPMGGYNTPQEAYFGFRIVGYCSGTSSFCNDIQATTNTNLLSFLNAGSNTFTLYTQINQYSESKNSIYSGQVYPHNLREGINTFRASTAIEETLYLDRIQLLDSYGKRFIGIPPPVIQQTITTSRYQLGELTKAINVTNPYYELRLRPSGNITKVYLVGSTTDVIWGIIGGCLFLCFIVFHIFGKAYNNFNVRLKIARQSYHEQVDDEQWGSFLKFCYVSCRPLLYLASYCNPRLRQKITRMKKVDKKIKYDLDPIQMIKSVNTCARLSSIPYNNLLQKQLSQVYFKQKAFIQIKQEKKEVVDVGLEDYDQHEESQQQSSNQVINQGNPLTIQTSKHRISELNIQNMDQQVINRRQPYEKFRNQSNIEKSKTNQTLAIFDRFHSNAEFTLKGKWRFGTVFGFALSLLTIGLITYEISYYIIHYSTGLDRRISHNRGLNLDPFNIIPIQLNTTSNFRAAFGFYSKPNFAFQNVSHILNSTTNATVSIVLYQVTHAWVNNLVVINQTRYDLVPCPANYFDGFMNSNQDPSYFSSVVNGFCLPSNMLLNITSNFQSNSQFFKISVFNRSSTGSTLLQNLTSSFSLGIYMTIPAINLQTQSFGYQVQQIRPNSEILSRAYNVNVTLTKQSITFTSPNYTLSQNATTITTYNYVESRAYEITNVNSPTTAPRVYNITFCHSGLMETFEVTYADVAELFGIVGGISLIIIFFLGWIAQSFASYYIEVLIGRQLYLIWPNQKKKKKQNQSDSIDNEEDSLLNGRGMGKRQVERYIERVDKINQFSQFDVFKAWLISFPAKLTSSYDWSENLSKVELLRSLARVDLDLFEFHKNLTLVRDVIDQNPAYRLKSNEDIPLTSIYDKKMVIETCNFDYGSQEAMYGNVMTHRLSSRDQWRLHIAEKEGVKVEEVFGNQYLKSVLVLNLQRALSEDVVVISNQAPIQVNQDMDYHEVEYHPKAEYRGEPIPQVAPEQPLIQAALNGQFEQVRIEEQAKEAQNNFEYNIQMSDNQSSQQN